MRKERQRAMNREAWLTELAARIESEVFTEFALPAYRVSCGWPSGRGAGAKRLLGECHSSLASEGGIHEIFISPCLDNPLHVASVLCHELAHVAAGVVTGHGKHFRAVCAYVGLTRGKPSGMMPGEELKEKLRMVVEDMPEAYPHRRLLACV